MTGDGVELAVIEAGDRRRPTVVLLHGYPDSKELWTGTVERLQPRLHVIAYDVRGFGASSAPRGPAAFSYERLAGDLQAVVDELAPGRGFHLVGHDWGGIMGWGFAAMERFDGRMRSFTTIAGPSLEQVARSQRELLRSGRVLEWVRRAYRSWYVLALCTPGLPTLTWRLLMSRGRWADSMRRVQGLPDDPYFSRPSLASDGIRGSNLYRRNIPPRVLGRRRDGAARVPVQLIVPTEDHFISSGYYEIAERYAPRLVRRSVAATHWVPHTHADELARWITEFVEEVEST